LARRPNYGFEKRQREIKKQKKKEAKAERKRLKKEALLAEQGGVAPDGDEDLELTDDLGDDEAPEEELEDEAPAPKRGFFDT